MRRNTKKIQLPKNFAEKLLDCEIEFKLSDPPSKDTVKTLIQLYTQGVEYYESIRSSKYLYFQLKMNQIFRSAATMEAISSQPPSEQDSPLKKKMKSMKEEQKIQAIQIKHKQEKMFHQIAENTDERITVSKVKQIINDSELKKMEREEKVKKELSNQDDKLREKLEKRKSRAQLSKSFSSAGVIGETETKDTLFDFNLTDPKIIGSMANIKPIEVNFGNIINENESDEEESEIVPHRKSSFSRDPAKKTKSDLDLFRIPE